MKGTLQKNEYNVWVVRYRETTPLSITTETLPLHPDFIEMMDTCFTSKFSQEVEFEIVTEWENGEVGVNGLTYAKLIKEEKSFIDNREEKLETLAKLLAKSWFYGNWEWENPNERVMQMLMQDLGLYPFKNEDEMIQQTRVDEDLYKEAVDKVKLRNPRLMPIENHPVDTNKMIDHTGEVNEMVNHVPDVGKMVSDTYTGENPFDFVCQDPDCPHCIEEINQMQDDAVWEAGLEAELNKLPYTKHLDDGQYNDGQLAGFELGAQWGYNKAKETLFTEEQVREVIRNCFKSNAIGFLVTEDDMIRTIKQPKQ